MHERLSPHRFAAAARTLEILAGDGPLAPSELACRGGLALPEASLALERFLTRGLVRLAPGAAADRAEPRYRTVPEAVAVAVVDLGGTSVRAAVASPDGALGPQLREPTDARGGVFVATQVARLCRQAAERAAIPFDRVRAAAVGVPGVPVPADGSVRMAPNIAGLDGFDVRSSIAEALGVDVVLENDVNMDALGESWVGACRGVRDLVYVKVGTGIGAGVLSGGELVRGAGGAAGQLSAVPVGADPEDAESLRAGALERAAAGKGIRAGYRALSGREAEADEIFERALAADPAALAALDEAARALALGLGAVCSLLDPERIVLGGSIGARAEFLDRVRRGMRRIHPAPAPVSAETRGFEAALLGCLRLGLRQVAMSALAEADRAQPA